MRRSSKLLLVLAAAVTMVLVACGSSGGGGIGDAAVVGVPTHDGLVLTGLHRAAGDDRSQRPVDHSPSSVTAAPPTQGQAPTTGAPSAAPTTAAPSEGESTTWWPWLLLALAVVAGVIAVVLFAR